MAHQQQAQVQQPAAGAAPPATDKLLEEIHHKYSMATERMLRPL